VAAKTTLGDAIDLYLKACGGDVGKTKAQVLRAIRAHPLAARRAKDIQANHVVAYAVELDESVKPQTALNYLNHLQTIFTTARSAFGIKLDPTVMKDALFTAKELKLVAKSGQRERMPTKGELTALCRFWDTSTRRKVDTPRVVAFALFSTRRQDEITRITHEDLEAGRVLVQDMKNPGDKIGNHLWCDLVPETEALIQSGTGQIFPYTSDAISANFTRAW
jgi:hypothetical protein